MRNLRIAFVVFFTIFCDGCGLLDDWFSPSCEECECDDVTTTPEPDESPTPIETPAVTPVQQPIETPTVSPVQTPVPVSTTTPTPTSDFLDANGCPSGWFLIPGGTYTVGASPEVLNEGTAEGYCVSRMPLYTVTLDLFCVSPFPFPGFEGARWGGNIETVKEKDTFPTNQQGMLELIKEVDFFGMDFATVSQQMVALSTVQNDRWPNGASSWEEAHCDPDPLYPEPMGSYPQCSSRWGPGSLLTNAFWARADDAAIRNLLTSPSCSGPWGVVEEVIVSGGMTDDWNAFYGDDLWGVHQHGMQEGVYRDDFPGFLVVEPMEMSQEDWSGYLEWWSVWRAEKQAEENASVNDDH